MTVGTYRKRPVVIHAIQLTATNEHEVREWVSQGGGATARFLDSAVLKVWNRLEHQWINVPVGHWVIRGVKNEFYGCDPDVFASTYEEVD